MDSEIKKALEDIDEKLQRIVRRQKEAADIDLLLLKKIIIPEEETLKNTTEILDKLQKIAEDLAR